MVQSWGLEILDSLWWAEGETRWQLNGEVHLSFSRGMRVASQKAWLNRKAPEASCRHTYVGKAPQWASTLLAHGTQDMQRLESIESTYLSPLPDLHTLGNTRTKLAPSFCFSSFFSKKIFAPHLAVLRLTPNSVFRDHA